MDTTPLFNLSPLAHLLLLATLLALGPLAWVWWRGGAARSLLAKTSNMMKALAMRVGFSIVVFLCVLLAWKFGYIQPSGIPAGH